MTTLSFSTLYTSDETLMLADAHAAITKCELWDWMKNYEPDDTRGFMLSRHPNLERINAAMTFEGHSGSSYAWTMRVMEDIAKRGWEPHKNRVRQARAAKKLDEWAQQQRGSGSKPCPCRRALGLSEDWCGVAGGGVPACEH